jgi:predicted regulator of Ras-like GTPase activity (Roadblock/LC7/MglB family)
MNMPILAWTMSVLGAVLFFAAGMLFSVQRKPVQSALPEARESRPSGVHRRSTIPPGERARHEVKRLVEDLRSEAQAEGSERPGTVLRAILAAETRGSEFSGAVIADELGLVVASTGEHGDALAAYGAFLAGVGAKTSDNLPLTELRQLIVQDENDTTLTVRPIAAANDNFALVTLSMRRDELPLRTSTAPGR